MPAARWKQIHDDLKVRIKSGQIAPNTVLPAAEEIAGQWGVSRLTAHRALYELQRCGLVSRRQRLGTVVNDPSAAIRATVEAVFFNIAQRFEAQLLSAVSNGFGDDFRLHVSESRHEPKREGELIRKATEESDALVLFPTCDPSVDPVVESLLKEKYPVVCLDRYPTGLEVDAVLSDHYGAARQGMEWLVARGHRQIAHFTDFEGHVVSVVERMRAYRDVAPTPLIRTFPYFAPNNLFEYRQVVQMVQDALFALLAGPQAPTALFCLRDIYAAAAFDAAERLMLNVPRDLEILAFTDQNSLLLRQPRLVAQIHQDLEAIGRMAANRVRDRLENSDLEPERIRVPCTFVEPDYQQSSGNEAAGVS